MHLDYIYPPCPRCASIYLPTHPTPCFLTPSLFKIQSNVYHSDTLGLEACSGALAYLPVFMPLTELTLAPTAATSDQCPLKQG